MSENDSETNSVLDQLLNGDPISSPSSVYADGMLSISITLSLK